MIQAIDAHIHLDMYSEAVGKGDYSGIGSNARCRH